MKYDPLVTLATERLSEPITAALGNGSMTLEGLASTTGEDVSIIAAACRRMLDEGVIELDLEERQIRLSGT